MREIFKKKHELWLKVLFSAFALPKGEISDVLLDFADIEFRHMKWIAKDIVKNRGDFNFDRDKIDIKANNFYELIDKLIDSLLAIEISYKDSALFYRIKNDERYMIEKLREFKKFEDFEITAFNKNMKYKNLDKKSLDALILFLFEEIYKEYELILVYFYSSIHTDNVSLYSIYEDLIYESKFHLKSFAFLQAKLGLLSLPREVMEEVYKFEDLKKFLLDGIEEEKGAKEQCRALAAAVKDKDLSSFFEFINNQEDYHIKLMEEALKIID
ncbi:hypothetical protein [Nitrosophilus kaiyonis]|uniref:hypothetical protein n=1 Tax=Nitrosophilus kaiyonis TaxID=2930200 RepID=UPI00249077AB|nr:hypothetical protein [Nitrosophilus kaiyonis]